MSTKLLFEEKYIGAKSNRSFWTRGFGRNDGESYNLAYVQVTHDEFILKPHGGFLGRIFTYDIDHTIPRSRIVKAEWKGIPILSLYKEFVDVTYRDGSGKIQSFTLEMNRGVELIKVLEG